MFTGEEQYRAEQIFRHLGALQGSLLKHFCIACFDALFGFDLFAHRQARANSVDSNVSIAQFHGHRFCHRQHGAFGRIVVHQMLKTAENTIGGDIDDGTGAASFHARQHSFAALP